jgi:alkylation response protein AidB-like acyl-CoA dehydrogenase
MERCPEGILLFGSKKPCSLAHSMDLFTVSTPALEGMDASLAVVAIPAATPGLSRRPFWQVPILAGAESDEVVLSGVCVPEDQFFPLGGSGRCDAVQQRGLLWFNLLITACYIGISSALVERVLLSDRGDAGERINLTAEVEGAMAALEGVARAMSAGERGNDMLARMILVRYAIQGAIGRASSLAVELLGANAFIHSPDVAYLLAATRVLSVHPPGRPRAAKRLNEYLGGSLLVLD